MMGSSGVPSVSPHQLSPVMYRVTLVRILFRSPDASYVVASLRHIQPLAGEPDEFVAVGEVIRMLQVDVCFDVVGYWEITTRFGRRYRILAVEESLPSTLDGVKAWLGSGLINGLSPRLAARLVERFGATTLEVISATPERVLEVEGIGAVAVQSLTVFWRERATLMSQLSVLCGMGVTASVALRAIEYFGGEAWQVVRSSPYRLMALSGVGFVRADYVAERVGLVGDHPSRLAAGLFHVMEEAVGLGASCLPADKLIRTTASLLDVSRERVVHQLHVVRDHGELLEDHGSWYLPRLWSAEAAIESSVQELVRAPLLETFLTSPSVESVALSPEQDLGVKRGLSYPLSVVVGATGTGKSVVVGAVVRQARRLGLTVVLCAPTGYAAQRVAEATGQSCVMIQRALEFVSGHGCRRRKGRPLDVDLVVVDEGSMLDLDVARDLFEAIDAERTGLMIVGDDGQLPPVGPGQVFQDLVLSGLCPVTRLEEVHRQAAQSSIVRLAHQIRSGRLPLLAQDWGENHAWCLANDVAGIHEQLMRSLEDLSIQRGVARSDCQVLVQFRGGPLGAESLNRVLQEAAVPWPCPSLGPFRLGDRVRHTLDDYQREVFHGDVGRVIKIDQEEGYLVVDFAMQAVPFFSSQFYRLELAYCLTVDKAQGSKFPCVLLLLHTSRYAALHAELVYSAVTCATEYLLLLGSPQAYHVAVKNPSPAGRYSGLFRRAMTRIAS